MTINLYSTGDRYHIHRNTVTVITLVDTLPIKWTVHEGEYIYLDFKGNRTFY